MNMSSLAQMLQQQSAALQTAGPKQYRHRTAAEVRGIRRARANGATLAEIADRYGISTTAVWTLCTGKTYARQKREWSRSDAVAMLRRGDSRKVVAERMGVSVSAIALLAVQHGMTSGQRGVSWRA